MTFRVRRMADNLANPTVVGGDMTFGHGGADFLADSPTAVAQVVLTRLCLWMGEWYLNLQEGMPWMQVVLGQPPGTGLPDVAIRARIMTTPYVTQMTDYASTYNPSNRSFTVGCKLYTQFGQVTVAPAGALISPGGSLIMPLKTPAGATSSPVTTAARALPPPGASYRALPPPRRALPAPG